MNPRHHSRLYAMSQMGDFKNERQAWRALHDTKLREQKTGALRPSRGHSPVNTLALCLAAGIVLILWALIW